MIIAAAGVSFAYGRVQPGRPAKSAAASPREAARLETALRAARSGRIADARRLQASLADPIARKLVDWAVVDIMGSPMSAPELKAAIRRLDGWPRDEARRTALARARPPAGPVPYASSSSPADRRKARFRDRRLKMIEALQRRDARAAYAAIADHGQTPGSVAYAEGESFAGWLALTKLHKPERAELHFARLDAAVKSPVSKARAAYWRGRTAERLGRSAEARAFYAQGAVYATTFYGQLAAQKAGRRNLVLAPDPTPTRRQREDFQRAELTRAIRLLAAADERRLVRVFALHYGDRVKSREELALLVDELKSLGEQEASLLAYRRGARHGFVLHERGYPLVKPPVIARGAEPALVLAIARQESQFDPRVRSSAGARGMMQLLPGTGRRVAQEIGVGWSEDLLWDPQTNMRLGSRYLGGLVQDFEGSYPLAVAAYNAGPRRPPGWIQDCGDPRASASDAVDFIECIPFGETRNYVMNVMANYQMYRARLGGGRATLTAERSLKTASRTNYAEASFPEASGVPELL